MVNMTICGGSSMAGHVIKDYFSNLIEYNITSLESKDIFSDDSRLIKNDLITVPEPDIIINCIRCLVDESELNTPKAIMYNSYFPHYLVSLFKNTQTKIIHLSSDCVFSGKIGNYKEDAIHDGMTCYAKTRSLGEINNRNDITIRTSYIGPTLHDKREELLDWFLIQNDNIKGYCNAYWTGVSTLELAKCIHKFIEYKFTGLYHLVPSQKISKYDLLVLFKNIWGKKDVTISRDHSVSIDRSLIDTQNIAEVPDYEIMFNELFQFMAKNRYKYQQYFECVR